jgi:Ca-activated chloride channel family protein
MLKKFLVLACLGLALAGCDKKNEQGADAGASSAGSGSPATTLTVLAGSELKDIEPLLPQISKATGVQLQMRYAGTLDGVERLQNGEATDVAWFASNRYAMLVPGAKSRILASERTMLTPVVLGLKTSKARELGWADNPAVTWKDIATAAEAGRFTFGMTSPASSNTGFSGLLGLAAALSGKGDALEEKDVDTPAVSGKLASFFKAQRLTAGSSGWLAEAYMKDQGKVDGIINYASTLLSMNQDPALTEKLVLIYPRDGIVTADYPIMLVNGDKRAAYDKVVAYLRGVEFQEAMARTTLRRPVNPDAKVDVPGPSAAIAELAFPAKREVVDAILLSFDNQIRQPPDSSFVLDISGSMTGKRLDQLKHAMLGLSGADASISGRFARFRDRERITLIPFNHEVQDSRPFVMTTDAKTNAQQLSALSSYIENLQADGGTAIFSATQSAYQMAAARRQAHPDRFYSVVLLTDGQNMSGMDVDAFERWYRSLPEAERGIRVFPVIFGDADPSELKILADVTGGRIFDGRSAGLQSIFKEIRGYQ